MKKKIIKRFKWVMLITVLCVTILSFVACNKTINGENTKNNVVIDQKKGIAPEKKEKEIQGNNDKKDNSSTSDSQEDQNKEKDNVVEQKKVSIKLKRTAIFPFEITLTDLVFENLQPGYKENVENIEYSNDTIMVKATVSNDKASEVIKEEFKVKDVNDYKYSDNINFSKYAWLFAQNKDLINFSQDANPSENATKIILNKEFKHAYNSIKVIDVAYSDKIGEQFLQLKVVGNVFGKEINENVFVNGIKGEQQEEHLASSIEFDKADLIINNINVGAFATDMEKYSTKVILHTNVTSIDLKKNNKYEYKVRSTKIIDDVVHYRLDIKMKLFAKEFSEEKREIDSPLWSLSSKVEYYTIKDVLDVVLDKVETINNNDSHYPSYYVLSLNGDLPHFYRTQFFKDLDNDFNDLIKDKEIVLTASNINGNDKLGELDIDAYIEIIEEGKSNIRSNKIKKFKILNLPKFDKENFSSDLNALNNFTQFDTKYRDKLKKIIEKNKDNINSNEAYVATDDERRRVYRRELENGFIIYSYNFDKNDVAEEISKSYINLYINGDILKKDLNIKAIICDKDDRYIGIELIEVKYGELNIKDITEEGHLKKEYKVEQKLEIVFYFTNAGEVVVNKSISNNIII